MSDYIYPNAVVYLIIVLYEIYVGSSVNHTKRMVDHKSFLKTDETMKLYTRMRELDLDFDSDDVEIIILEKYPCDDIKDLRRREGEYQRELEPTLNSRIEGRTDKEYREGNKEKIKNYCDDNKEHKQNYDKEYREKNKDHLQELKHLYRHKNRETINKNQNEKIECQYCNMKISRCNMSRHHKVCPDKPSSSS